ncbi:MAG: T9SS type A sorting domain-containing protein [Paludibacter sp.]
MARYGLLFQNKCVWKQDTILKDRAYYNAMINTSQNLNKSYGYLWWLNGKESFMLPSLQKVFSGSYAPDAPSDMYAALGKNGQILCIAPSLGLVVVRMGEKPEGIASEMPFLLCNQIWKHLNEIMQSPNGVAESYLNYKLNIYPNPTSDFISFDPSIFTSGNLRNINIYNSLGESVINLGSNFELNTKIDISHLPNGLYAIAFQSDKGTITEKFIVNK